MTARLDPLSYVRVPKLDVAGALGLAKILLHRVPHTASPAVHQAAAVVEHAVAELETKWTRQFVPPSRIDVRPLAHRLDAAWSSIRNRLVAYTGMPPDDDDRRRALALHDLLFSDGLEFLQVTFPRKHAESNRRIGIVDERGLAADLERLAGDRFVAVLRAAHQAFGDALGITTATPPRVAAVAVAEQLRALAEAISDYALQLIALTRTDPETREAVGVALAPIDAFRAAARRRVSANVGEEDDADVVPIAGAPPGLQPTGSG